MPLLIATVDTLVCYILRSSWNGFINFKVFNFRFAGKTVHGGVILLITVTSSDTGAGSLCVNCEKMVIGSMIFKQLKEALTKN